MARPTRPAPDLRARTRLDRECGVCKMAKPAADGVALARSDGGYAERVGESGGRGEALDAARARLRALVAEGGVAGGRRAPPI